MYECYNQNVPGLFIPAIYCNHATSKIFISLELSWKVLGSWLFQFSYNLFSDNFIKYYFKKYSLIYIFL